MARHVTHIPILGDVDWEAIASTTGRASANAAQAAYNEATKVLTYKMNNELVVRINDHEGPGGRKVITNSSARARLSSDYDGADKKFTAEGTYW